MLTGVFLLGIHKQSRTPFLYINEKSKYNSYECYFATQSIFSFLNYPDFSISDWFANYRSDIKRNNYVFLEETEFKQTTKILILTEQLNIIFYKAGEKSKTKVLQDYLTITKPTKNENNKSNNKKKPQN